MRKFITLLYPILVLIVNNCFGQFNTPTVDGSISTNEYGTHSEGQNQLSVDSRTWFVTWDNTNLYVGITGHTNFADAIVLYLDIDPQMPVNSGDNTNGSPNGTNYDGVTPNFPFRSDFFAYVKTDYDDYKTDDGTGGWGSSTTGSLTKSFNDGNDVGEFAIPWSAITGSSRPTSFNFVGFMSYSSGTFARVPVANPSGTSPDMVRYYTISSTADNSSTAPFSQESYCHVGADVVGFGAISVYDFTMNTSSTSVTRASGAGGVWVISHNLLINDGTVNFGSSSDLANVGGDVTINSGGILTLSSAVGGDIKIGGSWDCSFGTFNPSTRAVFFTGGNNQTILHNSNSFDYVLVDKSGGNLTYHASQSDLTIDNNLQIDNGDFEVGPGKNLTVTGDIVNSGTLTLKSTSSGTASLITNGTVTGDVSVERYMTNDQQWQFISSPINLSASNFDAAFGTNDPTEFRRWDEAHEENSQIGYWIDVRGSSEWSNSTFAAGKGYALSYNTTKTNPYSLTGEPYNASQSVALTKTTGSTGEGWNLVGNPFPATLAANTSADASNNFMTLNSSMLDDTYNGLYFWDEGAGDYVAVNNSSGATFVDVGRAFMVKTKTHNNSLSFNTNLRKHATSAVYKSGDEDSRFNMALSNDNGLINEIKFVFADGMSKGLDVGYDAGKYPGNSNISLYSFMSESNGSKFEIQALPAINEGYIIPIGFNVKPTGTYKFSVHPMENFEPGTPIVLEDHLTGVQTDLTQNPEYSFTIGEPGTYNDRFILYFKSAVGINETISPNKPLISIQSNQLNISNLDEGKVDVKVLDIMGRVIDFRTFNTNSGISMPLQLNSGIYVLEITTNTSKFADKFFIR